MKIRIRALLFNIAVFFIALALTQKHSTIIWHLNNPDYVNGIKTTFLKDKPTKINSFENALYFDGIDDGLLINFNPIANSKSFTIEIIFMPDSSTIPEHSEQRFLHIKNKDDSKRILIELRLVRTNRWSLDTFIKSSNSRCTLLDTSISHPTNKWYHVALTYSEGIMKHFVNGKEELFGEVNFEPFDDRGSISIGVRQNMKSWFKGIISYISFTNKALEPKEFSLIKKINLNNS